MIKLNHIDKSFIECGNVTNVLFDVSLEIKEGEFVCLNGVSGSGKTTLLNIIGLLEKPTKGDLYLDGEKVNCFNEAKMSSTRNKKIGYIFQNFFLLPELTVLENICVPMGYAGIKKKERIRRAKELLKKMKLESRMNHYPKQLSGGERQRVAIARALANEPEIILADEPTGNLDIKNTSEIMSILEKLHAEGTTIVMVTHEEDLLKYSTRIIRIDGGKIM